MITSIVGTLERVGTDWADVSVGGVTLRASVPGSAVEDLGPPGERVRLFTSLQVREDSLTLFGFPTEEAREAFEALVSITGVGPRLALSVLSRVTPDSLSAAVADGDVDALGVVPGVGKKTASRIVLELKGKLDGRWAIPGPTAGVGEAIDALIALGYSPAEARQAVSNLPSGEEMTLEDKVRHALQRMAER